jgi:hypothetical protein
LVRFWASRQSSAVSYADKNEHLLYLTSSFASLKEEARNGDNV